MYMYIILLGLCYIETSYALCKTNRKIPHNTKLFIEYFTSTTQLVSVVRDY